MFGLLLLPLSAQEDKSKLNLKTTHEDFLDIVAPLITRGEVQLYKGLPDYDARRYFQQIFWYKRDPNPRTAENTFRKNFFDLRSIANALFSDELPGVKGSKTDRGVIIQLYGEPENTSTRKLPGAGLRPGYEEVWEYGDLKFTFVYDGVRRGYNLKDYEKLLPVIEKKRGSLVLDRAEPYSLTTLPLTLPNLGFTKDIENLASEERNEIDVEVSYTFFPGDSQRTDVLVGLTFRDASKRGLTVHLAAYDPYGEKVKEYKKFIEPTNGELVFFGMAIEPDQYDMVLRMNDKDGREGIHRTRLDVVPLRGNKPHASGLLLAGELKEVPLYGFLHPKKLVYDDVYFPIRNDFTNFKGERIFVNQSFHNFPGKVEPRWYLNHRLIQPKVEQFALDGSRKRMVISFPVDQLDSGLHHIKSVYEDEAGNLISTGTRFRLGSGELDAANLPAIATESDRVRMVLPAGNSAAELTRIVARADGLKVNRAYFYLNGKLIQEASKAPYEASLGEDTYSISGQHTVDIVMQTDKGLIKTSRTFEPVKVEERYGTRLVQIYFNAYDEELNFIKELDTNTVQVNVDNEAYKAKEIKKVADPITYCFLVDISYSMKDSFNQNISALKKFIDAMRPQDKGYFVTFSDNYTQLSQPNLSKAVLLAVADSLKLQKPNPKDADRLYNENKTYLYDATIAAIHTLVQYPGRNVVLMVSDGVGIEGEYKRNGMLSYARENDIVLYSLWLDNNPKLSEDDENFLEREMTGGERFARKIGLSRFFAKKDSRKTVIGNKVRNESITQGILKILAEESGGFHYRIFREDRTVIAQYVQDITEAVGSQYVATLTLPVSKTAYEIDLQSTDEKINIRNKSKVKVSKTNPLL